mgnify:CR=1 FL=1
MNNQVNVKGIKTTAKAIEELKETLANEVAVANAVARKYKDWKSEEESVDKALAQLKAKLEETTSTSDIDSILNDVFNKNYYEAKRLMKEIKFLDGKIEATGKIVDDIKVRVSKKNREISEMAITVNRNSDTELVKAVNTINEFVESDLFKDANDAMSLLDGIIRENADPDDPEAILDGSPDPTEIRKAIDAKMGETPWDKKVRIAKEQCPMIREKEETGHLNEDACETCKYIDTCEMLNCSDDSDCDTCIYSEICLLCETVPSDNSNNSDDSYEWDDDIDEANGAEIIDAEIKDESETPQEDIKPLFEDDELSSDDGALPSGLIETSEISEDKYWSSSPSNQLSYCADSALRNIEYVYKEIRTVANNRDNLDDRQTKFFNDVNSLKNVVKAKIDGDQEILSQMADFYNECYSEKIDNLLGDNQSDEDRISIDESNDENYDSIGAMGICNAVDSLTNDLCDDTPNCDSFEFNLDGELKIVTAEGFEATKEFYQEFHSEAIDFIKKHQNELAPIFYSVNFKSFAELDINDCLQSSKIAYGFNEGEYYSVPLPAPIIDKYIQIFCGEDSKTNQDSLTLVKMIINVINRFNFDVDESCVLKYLRAHAHSSMSMESVIYRNDIYAETFGDGEYPSNDAIGTTTELGIGYSQSQIVSIIKDELSKIPEYANMDGNHMNQHDETMSVKTEIANLVYQIWFNQICKVLFNNDVYTIDDADLVDGGMALIIDTQPTTNFEKCMVSHFRPFDVLVAVDFIYTLEMLAENKPIAYAFNLTHTLGAILSLDNNFDFANNTYGQRLDIDMVYKIWNTYIGKAKDVQLKELSDDEEIMIESNEEE